MIAFLAALADEPKIDYRYKINQLWCYSCRFLLEVIPGEVDKYSLSQLTTCMYINVSQTGNPYLLTNAFSKISFTLGSPEGLNTGRTQILMINLYIYHFFMVFFPIFGYNSDKKAQICVNIFFCITSSTKKAVLQFEQVEAAAGDEFWDWAGLELGGHWKYYTFPEPMETVFI